MLRITSHILTRTAALPENVRIELDQLELNICSLIKKVCMFLPNRPIARIAGGWVRDKLLGHQSKDLDITIEGTSGTEFARQLRQYAIQHYGPNQQIVSTINTTDARPEQIKRLAVAFLRIYGENVEILNLRGNEEYEDGSRNPVSVQTNVTPLDDALRRDLTINAMFYNIITERVEDYTGKGYDDLASLTLRTPLEPLKTFRDDPLRLLRVLRFHSRYANSRIAPEVLEAMRDEDVQFQIVRRLQNPKETKGIVPERTSEELRSLMAGAQPAAALRVMYECGLLEKILMLPSSFHPLNMDQRSRYHRLAVIDHTLGVVENVSKLATEFNLTKQERIALCFSALFHDIGKLDPRSHKTKPDGTRGYSGNPEIPDALSHQESSHLIWKDFAARLKMTNEETDVIGQLVGEHMTPHSHTERWPEETNDRTLRKYIRKHPLWRLLYIHAMADAMAKNKDPDHHSANPYRENLNRMYNLQTESPVSTKTDLLNGSEIMQIVGLPARPPRRGVPGYIDVVKERIHEHQDANPALTKDEAINIVQTMLSSGELEIYRV